MGEVRIGKLKLTGSSILMTLSVISPFRMEVEPSDKAMHDSYAEVRDLIVTGWNYCFRLVQLLVRSNISLAKDVIHGC